MTYDPIVQKPDADLASRIVWFDAYVTNVDRTARNTNMLHVAPQRLWLIDHGATLYFHHSPGWDADPARARDPFPLIRTHVLLDRAAALDSIDDCMARALTADVIAGIVDCDSRSLADGRARPRCGGAAGGVRALSGRAARRRRGRSSRRRSVPAEYTYDYAIVRIVPRVERGEQINVGVILSCVDADFLEARIELDAARLLALDPALDLEAIRAGLATIPAVCAGGADAGPIGALPQRGRFRWLVSPRSTMIQTSRSTRAGRPIPARRSSTCCRRW